MQAALQAFVDNSLSARPCNFPDERHRGRRGHGLPAGLGARLQGPDRVRDRQPREGGAGDARHRQGQGKVDAPAARRRPPAPASATPAPVPMFHESKKPRPTRLTGSHHPGELRRWARPSSPSTRTAATSPSRLHHHGQGRQRDRRHLRGHRPPDLLHPAPGLARRPARPPRRSHPAADRHRQRPLHRLRPQPRGLPARRRGPRPGRIHGQRMPNAAADGPTRASPAAFQAGARGPVPGQMALKIGDLCPECGEAALVNEEGCRKCYSCGYSQC